MLGYQESKQYGTKIYQNKWNLDTKFHSLPFMYFSQNNKTLDIKLCLLQVWSSKPHLNFFLQKYEAYSFAHIPESLIKENSIFIHVTKKK